MLVESQPGKFDIPYLSPQSQLYMIVEPSSAPRCWTSEYRIPRLPHLGQSVFASMRSVCTLCLSTVWTIDSFVRSAEGKSEGFVLVVTVFQV
jgi:hypothetical protein